MSYGLLAILDDIAALAKMAATSIDDVVAQAARSGTHSLGLIIDDAAVTPRFIAGVSPARELPAIWKIARWSLINKLLILTPAVLLLSAVIPWIITPILTLGGLYLAFEGAEKVLEWMGLGHHEAKDTEALATATPQEIEAKTVSGAVRTDFILSTEIMVLTFSSVADQSLATQIGVMLTIGVVFTLGVYGAVALIVRADDIGIALAKRHKGAFLGRLGRHLVVAVAPFLTLLGIVGTLAMLWVGGSLLIHGLAYFHLEGPEHWLHHAQEAALHAVPGWLGGAAAWITGAALQGLLALAVGGVIAMAVTGISSLRGTH
ncbi:DUF808 domain-containing protein [Pseudoroseicyclus aestuarii]|uniref:Inner membrane protein YedI n=1 Tax=Pseudoroseicyclus aestuarii TaxID=1795041 RepID=A0A318SVY5_9RHOB|nr:DUF808 domain-containing protein [Pseudoroseicyclus aestuarii]PYE85595.1 hypothetical protein DFP88_101263 [Pseudoroseicyclus aestuarii]